MVVSRPPGCRATTKGAKLEEVDTGAGSRHAWLEDLALRDFP